MNDSEKLEDVKKTLSDWIDSMKGYEDPQYGKRKIKDLLKRIEDRVCPACGGSGRYDAKGSPKCSSCNGTGRQ